MTALIDLCRKYFNTKNLYKVLDTDKNATDKEVRKAYYMLSMKYHPDKVTEQEKIEATEKFKVISRIHALLSDVDKRKLYDETGCVGDDIDPNSENDDFPWGTYWRSVFRTITVDDIKEYELKYKGSDDEKRDLRKAYVAGAGDIEFIINMVPFSSVNEEDRLREILDKIIEDEHFPMYEAYNNDTPSKKRKRLQKAKREEAKYEAMKKNDDNDLISAIQKRSAERSIQLDDFVARMEAKYCKPKATKKPKNK